MLLEIHPRGKSIIEDIRIEDFANRLVNYIELNNAPTRVIYSQRSESKPNRKGEYVLNIDIIEETPIDLGIIRTTTTKTIATLKAEKLKDFFTKDIITFKINPKIIGIKEEENSEKNLEDIIRYKPIKANVHETLDIEAERCIDYISREVPYPDSDIIQLNGIMKKNVTYSSGKAIVISNQEYDGILFKKLFEIGEIKGKRYYKTFHPDLFSSYQLRDAAIDSIGLLAD